MTFVNGMPQGRNSARRWLADEGEALLSRLDRIRPFVLYETMVQAAAPSLAAQSAIERYLVGGRKELRREILAFLRWLRSAEGQRTKLSDVQRRYTFLKMRFNNLLSQFDIFADVMTQRSEHINGVWLAGLDVVAADALDLPGNYLIPPPVVCYLDRGHGAAIRRARTRLPGGGDNPVAVVRVPRERMVSSGIASSLVHEVGHQGAALLDLVNSLRGPLNQQVQQSNAQGPLWEMFSRWLSEILADFWSVARVGIGSTLGLMGVVSLPRPFVFRISLDDPHPIPWVRVKLSCAMGNALYPDPQWQRLAGWWEAYYPLDDLNPSQRLFFRAVEDAVPDFVSLLVDHRPDALDGRSLGEVMSLDECRPERLRVLYQGWRGRTQRMRRTAPALVFAALGQARADGQVGPRRESAMLSELLTYWALRHSLDASTVCSDEVQARGVALVT